MMQANFSPYILFVHSVLLRVLPNSPRSLVSPRSVLATGFMYSAPTSQQQQRQQQHSILQHFITLQTVLYFSTLSRRTFRQLQSLDVLPTLPLPPNHLHPLSACSRSHSRCITQRTSPKSPTSTVSLYWAAYPLPTCHSRPIILCDRRLTPARMMRVTAILLLTAVCLLSFPSPSASKTFLESIASLASRASHFPLAATAYHKFASYFTTPATYHLSPADAHSFLRYDPTLKGSAHIVDVRKSLLLAMRTMADTWRSTAAQMGAVAPAAVSSEASTYPYWRMIPAHMGSLVPNQAVSWTDANSSACFGHTSAISYRNSDGTYTLSFTLKDANSVLCSDTYLLATLEGLMVHTFTCLTAIDSSFCDHTESILWTPADDATDAELWDIDNKGIRAFRFTDDMVTTVEQLAKTVFLFEPLLTPTVSDDAAAANIDFLAKYANVSIHQRKVHTVPIDTKLISSGDFFGVMRLDGLDPMLAWAMGAHTGHTVLAVRDESDKLFIVEATNNNSYWAVNGVQKTEYETWLANARKASYNVVWAPLTPEARAQFNASAALDYFATVEGFDYGYQNILWAWQDTVEDNYPCLPPSFGQLCLTPAHVQILFGALDRAVNSTANILFLQAWNKRIGTEGLTFAEILRYANQTAGIRAEDIPVMVEKDSWVYETTRFGVATTGPALVCCSFVCEMWKAGGLFGNLSRQINCAEQTNLDDYTLNFLTTPSMLPPQCAKADPNNSLCQLEGDYSVDLGAVYGTRQPYAHMDEWCPSRAPGYERPSQC